MDDHSAQNGGDSQAEQKSPSPLSVHQSPLNRMIDWACVALILALCVVLWVFPQESLTGYTFLFWSLALVAFLYLILERIKR